MTRETIKYLTVGLALLIGCKDEHQSLVGTWKFVSDQKIDSLENVINQDNNVDGQLTYTDKGDMSVQLIWFGKRELIMNDSVMNFDGVSTGVGLGTNSWTDEQNRTWIDTYDAYFGEYDIDEEKKIVAHKINGNLRPERKRKEYKRHYKIVDDTLFLKSTDSSERWRTVWTKK